jgi:glutamate N-acetyltransferase / amino-acid N-acetyltransferase
VAGVFTKSACASSEVELGRESVKQGRARALIVNAGNSNAFTGYRGREAVEAIIAQVSEALGCASHEVFVSSTGVIGVPLPKDKARPESPPLWWPGLAAGRMRRTPSAPPTPLPRARARARWSAAPAWTLAGIIKGSGMIAPDMATMLGYIFTDADVAPAFLQEALERANAATFSCITVDGDTSTSDTVMAFRHRQGGQCADRELGQPRRRCLCRRARRCVPQARAAGGARWRRRAEIHHDPRLRRGERCQRPPCRPRASPIRRW